MKRIPPQKKIHFEMSLVFALIVFKSVSEID